MKNRNRWIEKFCNKKNRIFFQISNTKIRDQTLNPLSLLQNLSYIFRMNLCNPIIKKKMYILQNINYTQLLIRRVDVFIFKE